MNNSKTVFPESLNYRAPNFVEGTNKINASSYAINGSSFKENSTIKINLPKADYTFCDNIKLCGRIVVTSLDTATSSPTDTGTSYFNGNGANGLFKHYTLMGNNLTVENIQNCNIYSSHMMNLNMSPGRKVSNFIALPSETDGFSVYGAKINASVETNALEFDFNISLPGLLSSGHMLPLDKINWQVQVTTELLNIAFANFTDVAKGINSYTLSDMRLNFNQITLSPQDYGLWQQTYLSPSGVLSMHTNTVLTNIATIPGNGYGSLQIPLTASASSIRGALICSVPSDLGSGPFGSVHMNYNNLQISSGGKSYPSIGLDIVNHPMGVYNSLLELHGSAYESTTCLDRNNFLVGSTANRMLREYSDNSDGAAVFASGKDCGISYIDFETYSQDNLISGMSNANSSTTLNMTIADPLSAYTHTVYVFFLCNLSVFIDYNTGTISRGL